MSGAVAAHAAYNGSGTQGLAVTNKVSGADGDVQSVFWNKHDTTRQMIYGSSIVEIPASGSGGANTGNGNQIFSVNSDIDALGDLYLQITLTGATLGLNKTILDSIKKVEYHVGTQIWQTLEHDDIPALNATEMSEGAFESNYLSLVGADSKIGRKQTNLHTAGDGIKVAVGAHANKERVTGTSMAAAADITTCVKLPGFTKTVSPALAGFSNVSEGSYLMAAAPHQNFKIKVFTGTLPSGSGVELKLFGKQQVISNSEREQMKSMAMGMPKRIKMTQNHSVVSPTIAKEKSITVNVDLDHFSLYASHLIIGLDKLDCYIKSAELKLNSSSFSGEIHGGLLTGAAADSLGLNYNQFYVNSIPLATPFYIFPLASQAYGSSSVPLNRFDNIRLTLVLRHTGSTASSVDSSRTPKISVTCVGETTALYKNGAASLAMY